MKKLKLTLVAFALLVLSMTACVKEEVYECTCDTLAGEITFDLVKTSVSEAEAACNEQENNAGYNSYELD